MCCQASIERCRRLASLMALLPSTEQVLSNNRIASLAGLEALRSLKVWAGCEGRAQLLLRRRR